MKPVFTTQMKCAVVSAFVSLAFVSQASRGVTTAVSNQTRGAI